MMSSNFSEWSKKSGWRRKLPFDIWNFIGLTEHHQYVGWDTIEHNSPPFIMLEHIRGSNKDDIESTRMAEKFDDICGGLFYQRHWSSSGIPICREGECYWSGWWFQFKDDAEKFKELFGGLGSWEPGFEEWQERCIKKRSEGVKL